jgi:hypothetical protein
MQELIKALCSARAEFSEIKKTKTNPHFKSKYADLDAVIAATQPALSKHGLAVISFPMLVTDAAYLQTRLYHVSGEFIECTYALPLGLKPQEFGSALTYARRYTLCALLNVAAEDDDDSNGAGNTPPVAKSQPTKPGNSASNISEKQIARMMSIAQAAGFTEGAVKAVVKQAGFTSRRNIPNGQVYESICATLGTTDQSIVKSWNDFALGVEQAAVA